MTEQAIFNEMEDATAAIGAINEMCDGAQVLIRASSVSKEVLSNFASGICGAIAYITDIVYWKLDEAQGSYERIHRVKRRHEMTVEDMRDNAQKEREGQNNGI